MSQTLRVALPGYNALTDTNLDHFSLYADIDNVLIKRKQRGSGTVAVAGGGGYTIDTIAHNLGYIPFFAVAANYTDLTGDNWKLINNKYGLFTPPECAVAADTTNLYIANFQATTLPYGYDIFYDDMDQAGNPTITESSYVIKVARPGKNALTSRNPNDYIVHTDVNNFKILKQGRSSSLVLSAGDNTIAHGATITTPYRLFCFIKFPDGKTLLVGDGIGYSYDETKWVHIAIDSTNIHIYSSGAFTVDVAYIIYGTGTSNSIINQAPLIKVAASGKNVFTETNPDNFNFHSNYNTLKYYESNTWNMGAVTTTTVKTIAHNLGYVPFFIGFVNDLQNFSIWNGNSEPVYAIAPYYLGRSSMFTPLEDIGAFVYADSSNIYLKAYYQTNAIGDNFSFKWYYKLFKNDLGL